MSLRVDCSLMLHFRKPVRLTNLRVLTARSSAPVRKLTNSSLLYRGDHKSLSPHKVSSKAKDLYPKGRAGLEVCVVFFLFQGRMRGENHLFNCLQFFPNNQTGKAPREKKKIVLCERKRQGDTLKTFSGYCITKHTDISQKSFAVMLKSNCELNSFNKKEGSGALSDSASQTSQGGS